MFSFDLDVDSHYTKSVYMLAFTETRIYPDSIEASERRFRKSIMSGRKMTRIAIRTSTLTPDPTNSFFYYRRTSTIHSIDHEQDVYFLSNPFAVSMKIGLFLPCYIDQFFPQVGRASLSILEKLGHEVDYPLSQTCCGQPMANSGFEKNAKDAIDNFLTTFGQYDLVVAPSASCVLFIKEQLHESALQILELSEFLVEYAGFGEKNSKQWSLRAYSKRVGIHESCHGLRGLRLGKSSELVGEDYSTLRSIFSQIPQLEVVELDRKDECCGFGGTFSVVEEAVSVRMGQDRIADHLRQEVELMTATDMSCLMHLQGLAKRDKGQIEIKHFSLILDEVLQ